MTEVNREASQGGLAMTQGDKDAAPPLIHAVIPTLSAERANSIIETTRRLRSIGITARVFANGKSCAAALADAAAPVMGVAKNVGFAAAVNRAAETRSETVKWILILNDDVEIAEPEKLLRLANQDLDDVSIVSFGDEPLHHIQGRLDVFLSLSMLEGFRRRASRLPAPGPVKEGAYAPFSAVAIRTDAWAALDGLDERYPFSFEDSDFTRRARDAGYLSRVIDVGPVAHIRGQTGRRNVASVLPSAVWGGYQYLQKWGMPRAVAVPFCLIALAVRIPLLPVSRSSTREHFRGVTRSIRAIATNRRPDLPDYDDF